MKIYNTGNNTTIKKPFIMIYIDYILYLPLLNIVKQNNNKQVKTNSTWNVITDVHLHIRFFISHEKQKCEGGVQICQRYLFTSSKLITHTSAHVTSGSTANSRATPSGRYKTRTQLTSATHLIFILILL